MLNTVLKNFQEDGLLPLIKNELVAAVTDGAGELVLIKIVQESLLTAM